MLIDPVTSRPPAESVGPPASQSCPIAETEQRAHVRLKIIGLLPVRFFDPNSTSTGRCAGFVVTTILQRLGRPTDPLTTVTAAPFPLLVAIAFGLGPAATPPSVRMPAPTLAAAISSSDLVAISTRLRGSSRHYKSSRF
jgi:hypothetical protein